MTPEQMQEIVEQYEEGLITAAEALMKLLSPVSHKLNDDDLLGSISQIVVSMMKEQLADKTHYYKVCASGDVPLMYARRGKKHGTLMLRLDPDQASALDECFQHRGYYLVESDMPEPLDDMIG